MVPSRLKFQVLDATSSLPTNGEPTEAQIRVPQPFTYLKMKLFAFRDRKVDEAKNLGRHHALDL